MPYTGRLMVAGIAKESVLGTFVAPTKFLNFLPPFDFSQDITLLEGKGVQGIPDEVIKVAQGPALLKGGKLKLEVEPENIGEQLMAAFGVDTPTETASFVVSTGVNDTIDFNIGAGNLVATVAAGTYPAGLTQADAGTTLCKLIYNAIHAAEAVGTYTVSFVPSTGLFTITRSTGTFQMKFLTGPNTAKTMAPLIGFSVADQTGAITYTSGTAQFAPFSHLFTRIGNAALPSYSFWQKNGPDYPEFAGCMLSKMTIDIKAKEFITAEMDWIGMKYVAGSTQSATFSPRLPFKFDQAVITVAGSPVNDYEEVKIEIDNAVEAVHVVGNTINATKIYAKHFKVSVTATLIVENTTEWVKFNTGVASSMTIAITSTEKVLGTVPYSLTLTIPTIAYKQAPRPIGQDLLKVTFTADAVYNTGSTLTMSAALVNSVSATY